jgi:hypothetical protein
MLIKPTAAALQATFKLKTSHNFLWKKNPLGLGVKNGYRFISSSTRGGNLYMCGWGKYGQLGLGQGVTSSLVLHILMLLQVFCGIISLPRHPHGAI